MVNISGTKVSLRALVYEDHAFIHNWKNDNELNALLLAHSLAFTPEMAKEWIHRNTTDKNQVVFGIVDKENPDKLIGVVRLMFIDWINQNGELGIFLGSKTDFGKGIGKEVLNMILSYAFVDLNLYKIYLRVAFDNANAVSLYEKVGFQHEGKLRQQVWRRGMYVDVILMGILKNEFHL